MQFMVSVIDEKTGSATSEEMAAVRAFNDRLREEGHEDRIRELTRKGHRSFKVVMTDLRRYLLGWLEEAQLDRVGAFRFEPVEGAAANHLPDQVPEEVNTS